MQESNETLHNDLVASEVIVKEEDPVQESVQDPGHSDCTEVCSELFELLAKEEPETNVSLLINESMKSVK